MSNVSTKLQGRRHQPQSLRWALEAEPASEDFGITRQGHTTLNQDFQMAGRITGYPNKSPGPKDTQCAE